MLEAFQSLRDELTTKKQAGVDETPASASKPGPSTSVVNLDLPPPRPRTTSHVEHFLNTLALTFISFLGCFVFAVQKHYLFFQAILLY